MLYLNWAYMHTLYLRYVYIIVQMGNYEQCCSRSRYCQWIHGNGLFRVIIYMLILVSMHASCLLSCHNMYTCNMYYLLGICCHCSTFALPSRCPRLRCGHWTTSDPPRRSSWKSSKRTKQQDWYAPFISLSFAINGNPTVPCQRKLCFPVFQCAYLISDNLLYC